MKRLFMPALAALALLIGLTATSSTAYASDYSGNCSGLSSWDGSGNANVSDTNCTISNDVNATGYISITASGTVTTQGLKSGTDLTINAAGDISTQTINAGLSFQATSTGGNVTLTGAATAEGNMLLQASGNFQATSTLSATEGGIEIDANTSGSNTLFTIGGSTSNSVATSISAHNGVYIVNGTSGSTGGITIVDGSDINVNPQGGRAGLFLINAQSGTLTLTAGTLSSDGAGGQDAGFMLLLANTVVAGDSTTITASQDSGAPTNNVPVGIAATTITVQGTTGLTIHADDGSSSSGAQVSINPQGWLSIVSTEDVDSLGWTISVTGTQNAPLTFGGTGNLTMTSNGTNSQVQIGGYPITFNNGAVTAQSKWDSSTKVNIGNPSPYSGSTGVAFNNSGAVLLDTSASQSGDAGGQVWMFMDQFSTTSATSFIVHADGNGSGAGGTVDFFPSTVSFSSTTETLTMSADSTSGNGGTLNFDPNGTTTIDSATVALSANGVNGTMSFNPNGTTTIDSTSFAVAANAPSSGGNAGTVTFNGNPFALGASSNPVVTANGPTSGTGNGGTINFGPGFLQSISLGGNAGDISLSATGGSTSGNGGTIVVNNAPSLTLDSTQSTALNVSAPGSTGNGGTITISDWTFTVNGSGYALDANAGTSQGNGGTITINGNATTIGSGEGALEISANGMGTGDGGTISVTAQPLTVDGASITANPGSTDGNGGEITLNSNGGTGNLTLSGTLAADGAGNGKGGTISLTASASIQTDETAPVTVTANASGSGNAGTITFNSGSDLTIGTDNSSFKINANATGTGNGGIVNVTAEGDVTANGGSVSVNAGTTGNGGSISLTADPEVEGTLDVESTFNAAAGSGGSSNGNGGKISLSAAYLNSDPAVLDVRGHGTGVAGYGLISTVGDGATVNIGTSDGSVSVLATGGNNTNITGTESGNNCQQEGTSPNVYILTPADGSITFDSSGVGIDASATSGSGNQGGCVQLTTGTVTSNAGVNIKASGDGAGAGGGITISATNASGIGVGSNQLILTAVGGGSGIGGYISLTGVQTNGINPSVGLFVNSGASDTDDEDGVESINGVTCGQWQTGTGHWPFSYWDCVTPTTPDSTVALAAASATAPGMFTSADLRTDLNNNNAQIYNMGIVDDFYKFLAVNPTDPENPDHLHVYGISVTANGTVPLYASASFQNVHGLTDPIGSVADSGTSTIVAASMAHELGHQLDAIWGNPSGETGTGTFGAAISADESCTASNCINAPANVCAGTPPSSPVWSITLNDYRGPANICSSYGGGSNSDIFHKLYPDTPLELFAEIFEHIQMNEAQAPLENALGYFPMANDLVLDMISIGHGLP